MLEIVITIVLIIVIISGRRHESPLNDFNFDYNLSEKLLCIQLFCPRKKQIF
jgi:hypothetical protein